MELNVIILFFGIMLLTILFFISIPELLMKYMKKRRVLNFEEIEKQLGKTIKIIPYESLTEKERNRFMLLRRNDYAVMKDGLIVALRINTVKFS